MRSAENLEIGLIGQVLENIVIFVQKPLHWVSLGGLHVEFGGSFRLLHEHLGREGTQTQSGLATRI